MPILFNDTSNKSLELKEFIEIANSKIQFDNIDSLLSIKDELLMLGNNRSFFINYLNQELKDNLTGFQSENSYNEQSFLLHNTDDYYIRATYWPMLSENSIIKDSQNQVFSYNYAHDHNFALLTTGYKGEGYWTKIWQYDYDKTIGYVGEDVELNFSIHTNLCEKKAIFYEPSKDIHIQLPPNTEDSLAINVILKSYNQFNMKQYEFDIPNQKISGLIKGSTESKFGIIDLASKFGDDETKNFLMELSKKHRIPHVRQESIVTLHKLDNVQNHLEMGLQDNDKLVRKYFELLLQ